LAEADTGDEPRLPNPDEDDDVVANPPNPPPPLLVLLLPKAAPLPNAAAVDVDVVVEDATAGVVAVIGVTGLPNCAALPNTNGEAVDPAAAVAADDDDPNVDADDPNVADPNDEDDPNEDGVDDAPKPVVAVTGCG
jgi:hypothetical protein